MNALTIGLALLVAACGALNEPAIDQAMDRAIKVGGCIRAVCTFPPAKCHPSVGSCQQ